MNFIRQRLITLRTRAREMQTDMRRWALFASTVSNEMRNDLVARLTPAEREAFEHTSDVARARLRPVATPIETLRKWVDFLLERVGEQFERARALLDQGRNHECLAVLADIEQRMIQPNRDTLAFIGRSLRQRTSQEDFQKMVALDAIIRDLYLPTAKIAHQRGLIPKEALSRTPLAYLTDATDGAFTWRQHAQAAAVGGRMIPITLLGVPREHTADPWNLVAIAHEVGIQLYQDLQLGYEFSDKLLRESVNANVSPQTAPVWARWHETLFADVFGVLRMGPAYVSGMIERMGVDPRLAVAFSSESPAPPVYIRWHVMLQTLHLIGYAEEARRHFGQIHMLCGDPVQLAQTFGPVWMQLLNEARSIAGLIAFTPSQRLGGLRIIDAAPPFLSTEAQQAQKVRDLLLAGDESCVRDNECRWADSGRNIPAHLALAGLRWAYETTEDVEASRKLWIRFWCLMQVLTEEVLPSREREDREFAPTEAAIKTLAHHAVPAMA